MKNSLNNKRSTYIFMSVLCHIDNFKIRIILKKHNNEARLLCKNMLSGIKYFSQIFRK